MAVFSVCLQKVFAFDNTRTVGAASAHLAKRCRFCSLPSPPSSVVTANRFRRHVHPQGQSRDREGAFRLRVGGGGTHHFPLKGSVFRAFPERFSFDITETVEHFGDEMHFLCFLSGCHYRQFSSACVFIFVDALAFYNRLHDPCLWLLSAELFCCSNLYKKEWMTSLNDDTLVILMAEIDNGTFDE